MKNRTATLQQTTNAHPAVAEVRQLIEKLRKLYPGQTDILESEFNTTLEQRRRIIDKIGSCSDKYRNHRVCQTALNDLVNIDNDLYETSILLKQASLIQ